MMNRIVKRETDNPNEPNFFSPKMCAESEILLHHQCWCWGRDILFPEGNLLIKYGCSRVGVPDKQEGSNAYLYQIDPEKQLILWGFGLFCGDAKLDAGIFIQRYDFLPRLLDTAVLATPIWRSIHLPPNRPPRNLDEMRTTLKIFALLVRWILAYENWIERTCGRQWRRNCLRQWDNAVLSPVGIERGWRRINRLCEKQLRQIKCNAAL